MRFPAGARFAIAAACGLAAGVAGWIRASPMLPFLDVEASRVAGAPQRWVLRVTARGDVAEHVTVEHVRGPFQVVGAAEVHDLAAGRSVPFLLEFEDPAAAGSSIVRVTRSGRASSTRDLTVEERR